MLDPAADLGLDTVTSLLDLVYDALVPIPAVGEVAGLGGVLPEDIGLTLIGRVAPHSGLFAVEEIGQDGGVRDVGSGRYYSVNHLGFAIDPDMGFHAKKPLIPLLGLVHIGVPGLILVLGGWRGIDDRGIDDRAVRDLDALGLQVPADLLEELLTEVVLLEQMTELQNGRFIRHRFPVEVDTHEPTHGDRFVQGFFRSGIGEIEPLLEEINPEHALKPHRGSAVLALRVVGRNDRTEIVPRHHLLHIRKKLLATRGFPVGFEGAGG